MRRKDREVSDFSKMTEIMAACHCCRLGFVDGSEAYIVPMNFGYELSSEQLTLYFHCANEGRKLELLPKQSSVSFEMDTGHALTEGRLGCEFSWLYQCIMGKGRLVILSDPDEKLHGLQKIMAHYTKKADWEFDERLVAKTTVLKLSVEAWSCKEHI